MQTVNDKGRIIVHCSLDDELRCQRIINELKKTNDYVDLNAELTDSLIQLKVICIICCISKTYEKDTKRKCELQYAFKSQHRIVPVLIEHDFIVQEACLKHILDSLLLSTPISDLSGYEHTFNDACNRLHLEFDKFADNDEDLLVNTMNYLNIHQECKKQDWNEIPKLLLYIPSALLHNAIDRQHPDDRKKMISLMFILNDQFNGKGQMQIDRFEQWLIHYRQINEQNAEVQEEDFNKLDEV